MMNLRKIKINKMMYAIVIFIFSIVSPLCSMDYKDNYTQKIACYKTIDEKHEKFLQACILLAYCKDVNLIMSSIKDDLNSYRICLSDETNKALQDFKKFHGIAEKDWRLCMNTVHTIKTINEAHKNFPLPNVMRDIFFPADLKNMLVSEMVVHGIHPARMHMVCNHNLKNCGTLRSYSYDVIHENTFSIRCFQPGILAINPHELVGLTYIQKRGLSIHMVASLMQEELIFTDIISNPTILKKPLLSAYTIDKNRLAALRALFTRRIALLYAALRGYAIATILKKYMLASSCFTLNDYEFLSNIEWRLRALAQLRDHNLSYKKISRLVSIKEDDEDIIDDTEDLLEMNIR